MLRTVRIIGVFIALILINAINGCTIGMIGSMATQKSGYYEIKVPELGARDDILMIAEEVGKELGYKVEGKSDISISLKYATPMLVTMVFESMRMYSIMVIKSIKMPTAANIPLDKNVEEMQKELTIMVTAFGDYGAGGVEHAEKLANEFKEKLLQRINKTLR